MSGRLGSARSVVGRTALALRAVAGRRDGRAILMGAAAGYLLAYLLAVGHLGTGFGDVGVYVVADPLAALFSQRAPFSFEPVARLALGPVTLLLAPVNLALGLVLGGLVGANLAVSYLAWQRPEACGVAPGKASASGALAGVPALLSGAACCGPVVLLAVGVQATAGLLAAFRVLVPVAALLLVATLLLVGRRVDPALVGDRGAG